MRCARCTLPLSGAQEQNALPALTRGFAAPPSTTGGVPDTPLTQIMPKLVMIPRQVVSTAFNVTTNVVAGAATSGAIKSMVTSFAEKVGLGGAIQSWTTLLYVCMMYVECETSIAFK